MSYPFILELLRRLRLLEWPKDEGNSFGWFLWMAELTGRSDFGHRAQGFRNFGSRIPLQATANEQTVVFGRRKKHSRPADEKTDVFGQQ
jgi:hypothetical protein